MSDLQSKDLLPKRIVCLTEETTEWLYLLGEDWRIVGVSGFTQRPKKARYEKPRVSTFLNAKIDKILDLKPDWIVGFSDMQANIANDLIREGLPVTIYNQRSLDEIFSTLYQIAVTVGKGDLGLQKLNEMRERLDAIQVAGQQFSRRPRVYFEEWDEPKISAIRWVSELIQIAGGDNCFEAESRESGAMNRVVTDEAVIARDPEIVVGSWCGKKFLPRVVANRAGWEQITAVKTNQLYEVDSLIILQPGPASLLEGIEALHQIFKSWQSDQ
ncbi:MAG: cobalamin-binding protein [Sutterellaceae bacterium]|uniref:cobalamin-binding protein n=1 Tax=Limnobacter sp. UBA7229 TaxID=1946762 RepID=UPI000C521FC0|nr:cobalamin-binding protein [Limnobacter sp. UBA7229]MAG81371.1 cobalamin-binding protein [Sutterellaceae bacterium]MBT83874.1 cobalamin-binding protein [Sutterellaceae bacterium]|tara:strand:- start:28 stop:840 length:813 start_codon:yes stop_codon:yes gene_type:complete